MGYLPTLKKPQKLVTIEYINKNTKESLKKERKQKYLDRRIWLLVNKEEEERKKRGRREEEERKKRGRKL
ncbi:hypothetical protein FACS1894152_4770 [Bacilli bacterium]|nr:hypothetical protein FACS1894152_4770 [Bacilli bacterium]